MSNAKHSESRFKDVFDSNTTSREQPQENEKIAQKLHRQRKQAPKTHAAYWLKKVIKPTGSAFYGVQIYRNGQRHRFALESADKQQAAEKARDLYVSIIAHGWTATLEKFKPETVKELKPATIGEWLESVKATVEMRPITFATYAGSLRKIAADIADVGDQPSLDENGDPKKDRRGRITYMSRRHGEGHQAWIAKVHALPLSMLSAASIQRWKLQYLTKVGDSSDARKRAENSAAKLIRCARSLFTARAREFAAKELILPEPLPFAGVKLPKKASAAYRSKIDAAKLIEAARKELTGEPFKIFIVALYVGLRKKEIDLLTWAQVDFDKAVIRIERTEFFSPKSEDSIGEVDLDPELVAMLRGWKASASGSFVIESSRQPRHESSIVYYRCEPHFDTLYAWLRGQGITARKPLHELRKELGAILASTAGIFAAQSVLRHAQISTTASYYTDKKRRITAGLGALLAPAPSNVVGANFAETREHQIQPKEKAAV
jgi:integrase